MFLCKISPHSVAIKNRLPNGRRPTSKKEHECRSKVPLNLR